MFTLQVVLLAATPQQHTFTKDLKLVAVTILLK